MKTRRRMLKDALAQAQVSLAGSEKQNEALVKALEASQHEARELIEQRAIATTAVHERELAEQARDQALAERDAALRQSSEDQRTLAETIRQRDSWSERAQEVTVERDELTMKLRDEARVSEMALESAEATARKLEAAEAALRGSEESRLMGEQALAEAQQALVDCRQSRGIMQAQRDTILAAGAEQGIMIPMPGGPGPRLVRDAEQAVRESGPIGYDRTKPLAGWKRGLDADVEVPPDQEVTPDQVVTIGGKDGYDDHPGPAGAERLREEEGMNEHDHGDPRVLIDHWQGVAKRLESRYDAMVADNRALTDRANEATTRAAMAERSYSELHSRLVGMMAERDAAVEKLESEREQGLLPPDETRQGYASYVALRDTLAQVEQERDELRASLQQVKSERDELRPLAALADPVTAQMKIAEATVRVDRAEVEFANLTRERDEARAEAERARSLAMDSMIVDGAMENALTKLAYVVGVDQATIESPADIVEAALVELGELRARVGTSDVAASVERLGHALGIEKWNPAEPDVHGTIDTAIRRMAALDRERLAARSEAGALKLSLAIIDERQRQRGEGDD